MKLRDKILYMSFGAGLVVLGMVLNSLVSGDADAQEGVVEGVEFIKGYVICKGLFIAERDKERGYFGLGEGDTALLKIHGDDGRTSVAYLGVNVKENNEMMFRLQSKSKTVSLPSQCWLVQMQNLT